MFNFVLVPLGGGGESYLIKVLGENPQQKSSLHLTWAESVTGAHTGLALLADSLGPPGSGPGSSLPLTISRPMQKKVFPGSFKTETLSLAWGLMVSVTAIFLYSNTFC